MEINSKKVPLTDRDRRFLGLTISENPEKMFKKEKKKEFEEYCTNSEIC